VCYDQVYKPGQGWMSYPDPSSGNGPPPVKQGLPGDPKNYIINVFGVQLLFNEGGEVLDHRGRVVGHLFCYYSNECGGM
jgi:hypothetical protein